MNEPYEPVVGVEVHAVLETESKMFCSCPLVDSTHDAPNDAVCPVCSGMPGVLPVINQRAVEYALRVALALDCEINLTSIFARKSYFYPDLPKGYQISQYEEPIAEHGKLTIRTSEGEQVVRIRRVHIEEDTGKLTHYHSNGDAYSLVDLNRSGIPLLEIVTEPDLHSVEAVKAYGMGLRRLLQYVGVNSGDLEKGLLRIEPNISVRRIGDEQLGTRTEIKNLNSFRALERGTRFELERQIELLEAGQSIVQQTVGWDENLQVTVPQRSKEDADDYRYFPEPDLPPLVLDAAWVEEIRRSLPERPVERCRRFEAMGVVPADAETLIDDQAVADYFDAVVSVSGESNAAEIAKWITGELFGLMHQQGISIQDLAIAPEYFSELIELLNSARINKNTGQKVLAEMVRKSGSPKEIVAEKGLEQVSDPEEITSLVLEVLAAHPEQVGEYREGKTGLERWLFGQVMAAARGKANPGVVKEILDKHLNS